jgi:hypothetical protein
MKSLSKFAAENNLKVVPIRYRHGFGYCKRKGYDLINDKGHILASFEPVEYLSGDKWYLRDVHHNYNGQRYIKRITYNFLKSNINPTETSFTHLANFSNY